MKEKLAERYTYRVGWSEEDQCVVARCIELPSITGHGTNPKEAIDAVMDAARAAVEWVDEDGETPPQPLGARSYSGVMSLRIPPETHRLVASSAAEEGVSINQFVTSLVERNLFVNKITEQVARLDALIRQLQTLSSVTTVMGPEMDLFSQVMVTKLPTANPWAYTGNVQRKEVPDYASIFGTTGAGLFTLSSNEPPSERVREGTRLGLLDVGEMLVQPKQ
jgi:predicted RNase H-like HicB family nuclease